MTSDHLIIDDARDYLSLFQIDRVFGPYDFGANAAWLRMAVIAYKVLTALKRLALPAELLAARPKRLRFLIFNTAGRLVHHARQAVLRLARKVGRLAEWLEAMRLLPIRV